MNECGRYFEICLRGFEWRCLCSTSKLGKWRWLGIKSKRLKQNGRFHFDLVKVIENWIPSMESVAKHTASCTYHKAMCRYEKKKKMVTPINVWRDFMVVHLIFMYPRYHQLNHASLFFFVAGGRMQNIICSLFFCVCGMQIDMFISYCMFYVSFP